MIGIAVLVAPSFLLIAVGYAARRLLPAAEFWNTLDKLVYWLLIPALFLAKISSADLGSSPLGAFAAILYAGFFGALAFGWVAQRLIGLAPAQGSDVVQGAGRFNTFLGLAIAGALYGPAGLQAGVLGSALLVPVVNVSVVTVLAAMLGQRGSGSRFFRTLGELARNPFILSILAGLAFNLAGLKQVPVLHDTADMLGQAALPIMLLAVGANLQLRGIGGAWGPVALAAFGKLVVFPLLVLAAIALIEPPQLVAQVAIIYAALPVAASAYALARQMGGDAELMAAMISVQTALAFVTLPATLALAGWLY
ncbi:AEC family transporter [Phaeovulum sp.]|uniref:AEC family transporter n=1 Tax=Phaeovulum sp. TaxID=2934796 RepID=UPI002730136C|nr:AEC family transporter [Phaeovulum sp.]MDP1667422.1 AEC family transporter [Phaeovulum sp.]MDZ4119939.1 AEC family transporter [Phaeovulum sp.]